MFAHARGFDADKRPCFTRSQGSHKCNECDVVEMKIKLFFFVFQGTIETLQVELGRKDSQLQQFQDEKTEDNYKYRQLQKEMSNVQAKLVSLQSLESVEVGVASFRGIRSRWYPGVSHPSLLKSMQLIFTGR